MNRLHSVMSGLLSGLLGGMAAGIGARVAMRIVVDTTSRFPTFTPDGTLFVVLSGALLGMPIGALYIALKPHLPGPAPVRGLLFGLILLGTAGLPLWGLPPAGELRLSPELGRRLFGALVVATGMLIALIEPALARVMPAPRRHAAHALSYGALLLGGALGAALFASSFIQSFFPGGE